MENWKICLLGVTNLVRMSAHIASGYMHSMSEQQQIRTLGEVAFLFSFVGFVIVHTQRALNTPLPPSDGSILGNAKSYLFKFSECIVGKSAIFSPELPRQQRHHSHQPFIISGILIAGLLSVTAISMQCKQIPEGGLLGLLSTYLINFMICFHKPENQQNGYKENEENGQMRNNGYRLIPIGTP